MSSRKGADRSSVTNRIVAEANRRYAAKGPADIGKFVRRYYEHVPPRDLDARKAITHAAAAAAHRAFAAKRPAQTPLIRIYNPREATSGWHSDNSVLEAVNDDMPFLVDSVTAGLNDLGLTVHLVVHPVFHVRRSAAGNLKEFVDGPGEGVAAESFMRVEFTHVPDDSLDAIRDKIRNVLDDVRASVEDWTGMRSRMRDLVEALKSGAGGTSNEEVDEVRAFLQWAHDDQFTFLGCRELALVKAGRKTELQPVPRSGLGILRRADRVVFLDRDGDDSGTSMPTLVRAFLDWPELVFITKANVRSTIHRPVHMDVIGIKRFDAGGQPVGQSLFVGLFTSAAYNRSPRDIPLLRRKIRNALSRSEFSPTSHDGKALLNILETFPRDELFQVSEDHLFQTAMGILHLQERQRVAVFVRQDSFERFMSVLIYMPRDRYTYVLRQRMRGILERTFNGEVTAYKAELGDSPLVRLQMIVRTTAGQIPPYDAATLEAELVDAARSWAEDLEQALVAVHGPAQGMPMFRRYGEAFPASYQERFPATEAAADVVHLESTLASGEAALHLYRPANAGENEMRLKIFSPHQPIPLSDVLPMLEHMGLKVIDEVPHAIAPTNAEIRMVIIHDLGLVTRDGSAVNVARVRDAFEDAFARVRRGDIESDGFNGLVLLAGLHWREVVVLRALCKYLRQTGITFSQEYMERTLAGHSAVAGLIVRLFLVRFDPAGGTSAERKVKELHARIGEGLAAVDSADEDRILRRFLNLIDSMLRTNYFQPGADGQHKPYLSFKFDSKKLDELPLPRPLREIFVYSPRVEGVHLRFGLVARGGMRWSDRPEDFRTEVLGLVKAQQVKNAVIVPVGSKGGFVVKRPPPAGDRDAFMAEGIACYRTLIAGMLDITDNLDGGKVVPPPSVVRLDGDDPYLVVAADKGTATFSDYANDVSRQYGFWLGDAFASGGSQGYDHKGMGITARGAWESVKRHFREMGTDIQAHDFTVVGVGDMSGDVFGNGMLLSPHIKLLAAFNHLHIFVDPDPDPAVGLKERQRLFDKPRSSWADYDPSLLSKGGAIYPRSAKSLKLTPQIKERFGIAENDVPPAALMRALLRADVDLLWFGGIGTYVKASSESHADAGDRANDAIRLNGGDLRCRVVGEGANLGCTQRGRVEYALAGGRLNTDFIDNSAGVDTSDHEVNIKVLLDSIVAAGKMNQAQRNRTLASLTAEVGELVLRHNYQQSAAITLAKARGTVGLENHMRLMRMLERLGFLDRAVEFLPSDDALTERLAGKQTLMRPEIAVMLCYAKNWLYERLLESDLPDDPYLLDDLVLYFPSQLGSKYRPAIERHRLRREIIATRVANSLVNRVGETFVSEMMEKTGMPPGDIARAYTIARHVFAFRDLWAAIEGLDSKVPADVQTRMLLDINHLVEWVTLWFLRNGRRPLDIGGHVREFASGMAELVSCLSDVLPRHYVADTHTRAQVYIQHGVPQALALRIADLVNLFSGCDIVRLANRRKLKVSDVARLYFATGTRFRLGRMRAAASRLDAHSHWDSLAAAALVEELYSHQLTITSQVLDSGGTGVKAGKAVEAWIRSHRAEVDRAEQILAELWSTDISDISMIAVASRQLRALADSAGRA